MTTLISLIGEQPMPILLPARHLIPARSILAYTKRVEPVAKRLQKMIPNSELLPVAPYNFDLAYQVFSKLEVGDDLLVNLTGGTKMMSLAAFSLASQRQAHFCYLESENHRSRLTRYSFQDNAPMRVDQETLPTLISAADYLNAHLPGFREEVYDQRQDEGRAFEEVMRRALNSDFEVLAGVRPEGVADQIEIDLVIRAGNQVGIAEIKLGGEEAPKRGIDQLSTAGSQDYLGTYTAKFLIMARNPKPEIMTLAREKGVHVIALPDYRRGRPLDVNARNHLVQQVQQHLMPPTR